VVSARKYRPVTFETVVGQQHITGTLKNAIKNNQLAQAFLFCGPRGVGKTTCARILAKTINCTQLSEQQEACGECESCKSFSHGQSFNFHELDAASNNSVDDIRSLIEQVRIPPQSGKYKVYIIDEVHMLSASAFNAFLKTLEEPPSYAIFILATTEKHKILPTILSRCQIFDFNRIRIEDMAEHLNKIAEREGITTDKNGLYIIAQKADGGLRDALSMFDQIVSYTNKNVSYKAVIENLNILDYDYYFKLVNQLVSGSVSDTLLLFDEILNKGFDGNNFINGLAEHLRNLLVGKDANTLQLLEVSDNIKEQYLEQCKSLDTGFILTALNLANQCDLNYKNSKNQRLQVELALIKMCHIPNVIRLAQLSTEDMQDKKKTSTISDRIGHGAVSQGTVIEYQPRKKESPILPPQPPKPNIEPKKVSGAIAGLPLLVPSLKDVDKISKLEEDKGPKYIRGNDRQAFTEQEFMACWQAYADTAKEKNKLNLYTLLTKQSPVLDGTLITLPVENIALEATFQEEKIDLLNHLRGNLKNFDIQLFTKRIETEQTERIYTARDKYAYLVEKNPNLEVLRQKFGLDLGY